MHEMEKHNQWINTKLKESQRMNSKLNMMKNLFFPKSIPVNPSVEKNSDHVPKLKNKSTAGTTVHDDVHPANESPPKFVPQLDETSVPSPYLTFVEDYLDDNEQCRDEPEGKIPYNITATTPFLVNAQLLAPDS